MSLAYADVDFVPLVWIQGHRVGAWYALEVWGYEQELQWQMRM